MKEKITVDTLLENLSIYKYLLTHINSLPPEEILKTGCAYVRVSRDMQVEYSPEAQLDDIVKYCISNNIILPKENIFIEPGVSGTRADKRPSFQKMIAKAEEKPKPFDVILVHKLDRFARNREDSILYKSKLRKKLGIDVIAVKELLPEDRKLAMMMESQLESWGEYYSMNLSDEEKKGQKIKAENGESSGGPPLGYNKVVVGVIRENNKEKIVREMRINQEEAKIIKMIFTKFTNDTAIRQIALELNDSGFRTKTGGKFTTRGIEWILNNPVYIGYIRWTDGRIKRNWHNEKTITTKSTHESIIEQNLWDKAQEKLKIIEEMTKGKRKNSPKEIHWLSGILRCDSCGDILVKNGDRFQCASYTHGRCKISHSLSLKKAQEIIFEKMRDDFENQPININIEIKSSNFEDELSFFQKQLKQIEIKESRIKLAYENGVDSLDEYKENKIRILKDKNMINSKIEEYKKNQTTDVIRNNVLKRCKDAYEILHDDELDIQKKRLISHNLFDRIVYIKSEQKLVIYYK